MYQTKSRGNYGGEYNKQIIYMGISLTGVASIVHLSKEMPLFYLNYLTQGEIRMNILLSSWSV